MFTKFVSFGSEAFCKLLMNRKLKCRHFSYVKAPALTALNRASQWALCSQCPSANGPGHLETPQADFWLGCSGTPPPKVALCPLCCVSQKSEAGCGWEGPGFAKKEQLSRTVMSSLQRQQPWARGFTGTQYVCISWLRRAPCKAHLFQQASHNQIGCLATPSQIMGI